MALIDEDETPINHTPAQKPACKITQPNDLASKVEHTLKLSTEYALASVHSDGHWCGELRSNVTITAEYIFLQQALGLALDADRDAYCRYILSEQNPDGSWGLAPDYPGDVSTTTEAYLALKILGTRTDSPAMQSAQAFVIDAGGVAAVRVFTRIFLATFGLFPWDAIPQLPDMDSLCDTSCPDITGRILEAFGLMMKLAPAKSQSATSLYVELREACNRGICYLVENQEPNGAWFGRWGCNYVYGTSHALCGLSYFTEGDAGAQNLVQPALQWLKAKQNADGGWGESLLSYQHVVKQDQKSTFAQTAWALMGLLAHLPHTDDSIMRGIEFLVSSSQKSEDRPGASWPERLYTGTGFPNHFFLGYDFYRHYFPMMALGRFLRSSRGTSE